MLKQTQAVAAISKTICVATDAPCARECTKEIYPMQEDFKHCYTCGETNPFQRPDLGSIEIVFTINYTRASLLLGGVQSTLSTTCVSLLEEEGMKVGCPAFLDSSVCCCTYQCMCCMSWQSFLV